MQPQNINETKLNISVARLSSYRSMFSNCNDYEIYGLYCWNEALSSVLFRLISIIEVSMRNKFHEALSTHFYISQISIGRANSNDWYNFVTLPPKSMSKLQKETHVWNSRRGCYIPKPHPPNANDVVSRMTFGFWVKLLEANMPWNILLMNIVPGHRHNNAAHWASQRNQDALYARLDLVNKLRNRIAHFEPIWKQGDLFEERRHRRGSPRLNVVQPRPTNSTDVLQRLELIHDRAVELLKWLSSHRHGDYRGSYVESHFKWLCSDEGMRSYMDLKPGLVMSKSQFKREFSSIHRNRNKVLVERKNKPTGVYYPIF